MTEEKDDMTPEARGQIVNALDLLSSRLKHVREAIEGDPAGLMFLERNGYATPFVALQGIADTVSKIVEEHR